MAPALARAALMEGARRQGSVMFDVDLFGMTLLVEVANVADDAKHRGGAREVDWRCGGHRCDGHEALFDAAMASGMLDVFDELSCQADSACCATASRPGWLVLIA